MWLSRTVLSIQQVFPAAATEFFFYSVSQFPHYSQNWYAIASSATPKKPFSISPKPGVIGAIPTLGDNLPAQELYPCGPWAKSTLYPMPAVIALIAAPIMEAFIASTTIS